jgi:hypothetical protein
MKKITFALVFIFLFCANEARAQQTSVTYMPLIQSNQFNARVTFNITLAAPVIEVEAANATGANPACHTARVQLAARVMQSPQSYTNVFATALVTTSAITTAGALTGSLPLTLDTPATDAALFSAINSLWSSIAGCISNP